MSETGDLRARVAQSCRVLGKLELTKAATGHVSARIPGESRVLIRARGPDELGVRYTTEDEIVETDFDGKLVAGGKPGLEVPQEIFIHTEIYKNRPEVGAVVHMHPPTVVLFTICGKKLLPLYGAFDPPSALMALDGIPTFDRSILINTAALGQELARAMGSAKTCMMRGHGITAAGATIEDASLYAIQLNELATMNYRAHLLGNPQPISAEDEAVMRKMGLPRPGAEKGENPRRHAAALWRYYCALTED